MAHWVGLLRIEGNFFNLKGHELSSVALQVLEAQDRNPTIARDKMQYVFELFLSERVHILPEPADNLVFFLKVGVFDMELQIFDINLLLSIDDDIQLLWFKDRKQVMRNDFVETVPQVFDQGEDTRRTIVFYTVSDWTYRRAMYWFRLVEFTIM